MPRIPFTARSLEALKPTADAQIDYFDQSFPGFYLRISPRGRKAFGVMYRHAGRVRRMTFGRFPPLTLADAREKAKEELRKAAKGEDPAIQKAEEREADNFRSLAEDYMTRYSIRYNCFDKCYKKPGIALSHVCRYQHSKSDIFRHAMLKYVQYSSDNLIPGERAS